MGGIWSDQEGCEQSEYKLKENKLQIQILKDYILEIKIQTTPNHKTELLHQTNNLFPSTC
jgi:hypothetical protein